MKQFAFAIVFASLIIPGSMLLGQARGSAAAARAINQARRPDLKPKLLLEGEVASLDSFTVGQVIDSSTAILDQGDHSYWFVGPTTGWRDGQKLTVNRFVKVSGTKTYENNGGSTTTVGKLRTLTESELVAQSKLAINAKLQFTTLFKSQKTTAPRLTNNKTLSRGKLAGLIILDDGYLALFESNKSSAWVQSELLHDRTIKANSEAVAKCIEIEKATGIRCAKALGVSMDGFKVEKIGKLAIKTKARKK